MYLGLKYSTYTDLSCTLSRLKLKTKRPSIVCRDFEMKYFKSARARKTLSKTFCLKFKAHVQGPIQQNKNLE